MFQDIAAPPRFILHPNRFPSVPFSDHIVVFVLFSLSHHPTSTNPLPTFPVNVYDMYGYHHFSFSFLFFVIPLSIPPSSVIRFSCSLVNEVSTIPYNNVHILTTTRPNTQTQHIYNTKHQTINIHLYLHILKNDDYENVTSGANSDVDPRTLTIIS